MRIAFAPFLLLGLAAGCAGAGHEAVSAADPAVAPPAGRTSPAAPLSASAVEEVAAAATVDDANERPPARTARTADERATPRQRLTSQGYITWIRPQPKTKAPFLGYIRFGSSVALRSPELVRGEGCSKGFYQVEPRGYVCNDSTVTLEPSARFVEASAATAAASGPMPYRYAISNGAPMYNRVPKREEGERRERPFGKAGTFLKQPKGMSAHEDLAVVEPIAPSDAVPPFLADGKAAYASRHGLVRQKIPLGSMLSFTRAFEAEGRTWLLSPDLTVVPADRVRPFRPSTFRGVRLGQDGARLPLAWMRKTARPQHRKDGDALVPSGGSWPVRSSVGLTGASAEHGGKRYLETTDSDAGGGKIWILEADATVVEAEKKGPFGLGPSQKWFLVRITAGTLVAYEGMTPVYTTLISPGSGGVPVPGTDPVKMSTTPLGTYPVTFKDRAATMSPDEPGEERTLWISDVPHTQYFNPPFALHATYWHERFGEPTSAGCVNLSPIDAEAMFAWSDPQVPEGWQGATGAGAKENGPTTVVVVRR